MKEPIEPTGDERRIAIRICRANAHMDAETGRALTQEESRQQWREMKDMLATEKWLWMWNHARDEWRPAPNG
jgi:hypothetical protein